MKDEIIKIVKSAMGGAEDNLYRANLQFGKMTLKELNKPYGQSDKTCAEILNGYRDHKEKLKKCIDWLQDK
jgi:uncharacterized protein YjbJ (UPF0337 family)